MVTIVHGRHQHLRGQLDGLHRAVPGPDGHVVVALGDPDVRAVVGPRAQVVEIAVPDDGELPLASGRNAGADAAVAAGAELLIFLDVDCIPAPRLVAHYAAAAQDPAHADAILCGPVAYLPPADPAGHNRAGYDLDDYDPAGYDLNGHDVAGYDLNGYDVAGYDLDRLTDLATAHPARPNPAPGVVEVAHDRRLFWSLSFAVTAATWARVGGFHPGYVGYGGEDTDFVEQAHAAGVGMRWVGGASAFHQHHRVSVPPVEHVDAIVRNAHIFHERWGWWPMIGWLDAFADLGLAAHDPSHGWRATAPARP